jgi:hypothetical protein
VAQAITHKKWVKYQTEDCSACESVREAIEKKETCEGSGSAQTKGGVVQAITHKKWVKYQDEDCSACKSAREAIEKKK